ncbi:hypothetical protein H1D32_02645 [Anaerobacillus sp. CMMVII]|uniref:hypothetical protein n=1 Tax=Anaerobacillus sp. CMMVII TaxID=2755588 RepID=UPI0021B83FD7|nr:hypothetical protein [Anaerobacillus sp. CMMVII]MCT8136747.1 hypothetical protein [Anaerobacillus sp. CMMVII]
MNSTVMYFRRQSSITSASQIQASTDQRHRLQVLNNTCPSSKADSKLQFDDLLAAALNRKTNLMKKKTS